MESFDFSVIVCCYNSNYEKLKKTLISIIKQKDVSFEIIISDDGSKNRTIENIKFWADEHNIKNIKYNFLTTNVGTVQNILSATKIATGTFIKTISPGDYLFDELSLKQYLTKFNQSDYKLLFSKAVYYTQERKLLKFYNPTATTTKRKLFMRKNVCQFCDCFLGATIAIRREYLIQYLEKITGVVKLLEDYPLTYLMLINQEKVGFVNKNLVWYECDTGVSRTVGGNQIKNDFLNFFNYLEQDFNNKKIKKDMQFLRYLKTESKLKVLLKYSLIKPSFLLFLIDRFITAGCRKISFLFNKVNINMLDTITSLDNENKTLEEYENGN